MLESLHRQCLQLPTVVYTLHWEPAEDDACHVRTTTMSGVAVRHASVPRDEPVNVWKHLPPPLYRVAADGNLYTFQDYAAYYGEERSKVFWTRAAPCYDHLINLVTQDGDMLQWSVPNSGL